MRLEFHIPQQITLKSIYYDFNVIILIINTLHVNNIPTRINSTSNLFEKKKKYIRHF